MGPAVRAIFGLDAVFQDDDRPAPVAFHLAGVAGDRGPGTLLVAVQERLQVVFEDLGPLVVVGLRNDLGEPAVRALEAAGLRVEVELRPALAAGEFAARGRGLTFGGRRFAALLGQGRGHSHGGLGYGSSVERASRRPARARFSTSNGQRP